MKRGEGGDIMSVRHSFEQRLDSLKLPLLEILDHAARLSGRTKKGLQALLQRESEKVDGFPIHRVHGGVHRHNLLAFLNEKSESHTGRDARIRTVLAGIEARR